VPSNAPVNVADGRSMTDCNRAHRIRSTPQVAQHGLPSGRAPARTTILVHLHFGRAMEIRRRLPLRQTAAMPKSAMRNHNLEYQDNASRKYTYDFDTIIRAYLLETLERHFVKEGSVLELGCHKGDMTAQILEYFPKVTAVEAADELAAGVAARFPGRVDVISSTFEELELSAPFDNIFLVHTLEHLDDPVGTLARIAAWLSPGGRLYVAVPNANALSRQIAVQMGLIDHNAAVTPGEAAHGHRRTYSMDTLSWHAKSAGLRVLDAGGVIVKALANYQFDQAMAAGIVTPEYVRACNDLAKVHPELSASLYLVCARQR
jgi:2-polyprenyl-3-methyl-5-hydroxy-6-metoxy-1,4-benzoquinol methylase